MDNSTLPAPLAGDARFAALCELVWEQYDSLDLESLLVYLVDNVAAGLLPYLADQFHVLGDEGWGLADTDRHRRDLIKRSIEIHRKKGTPWAVKQALAAIGFDKVELVEHRALRQAWIDAGGEFLDGVGTLDGMGDLSPPPGNFRFITTNWAEYVLRLNVDDQAWWAKRQRDIVATCNRYAPARSRLVAVILTLLAEFDSTVRMAGMAAVGRSVFDRCKRFTVPAFDTLDGCDIVGGGEMPSLLDGAGTLNGDSTLSGITLTGEPLDGGQLGIGLSGRYRAAGDALGGDRVEAPETLTGGMLLDGATTLAGELLDGIGSLNADGDLFYPTLATPDDVLDGTSNLGLVDGPAAPWFSGYMRIWRGAHVHQESL